MIQIIFIKSILFPIQAIFMQILRTENLIIMKYFKKIAVLSIVENLWL